MDVGQVIDRALERTRVVVVANDPLARGAISRGLGVEPDLVVVAQASGTGELRAALGSRHPEVVLWDLGLNPDRAFEASGDVLGGRAPVLVLAPDADAAAAALGAGASGALPREASPDVLAAGLRAVRRGLSVLPPEWLRPRFPARPLDEERVDALTPREREVLVLLVEGLSNKLIAARLGISEHTAKFHVNALLSKLGVQSRTEAVVRAARLGLVTL